MILETPQIDLNAFADALKTARRARGLNQRELAKQLGIAPMVLSKLERAELRPDESLLATVAREFGVVMPSAIPIQAQAIQPNLYLDAALDETLADAARLPDAELRLLAGLGHLAHEEAPDTHAELIADFARRRGVLAG